MKFYGRFYYSTNGRGGDSLPHWAIYTVEANSAVIGQN